MRFLRQYESPWDEDQEQWSGGVNLSQVQDSKNKETCLDVFGVRKLACALVWRSSLRRSPSKLPHLGLDIFLCLVGNQSPTERPC